MPLFFARGSVYIVQFTPPGDPTVILHKYFVCLQEGRLFERADDFVAVRITSLRQDDTRKTYPTHVFLTPEESETEFGAKVICEWIHTIPKASVTDYAYTLTESTMREIEERLLIALGLERFEIVESEQDEGAEAEPGI